MDPGENERKVWKNYRAKINEIMKQMEEMNRNNVNPPDIRSQIQLAIQQCKQKNITSRFVTQLKKCSDQSEKYRRQGNKFFISRLNDDDLHSSYLAYNQSIAFAPIGSPQLALSYANKTALLMEKKKYKECLQTIENCLALESVTDPVKIKVLIRKVECQKNLLDPDAGRTYEEALLFIREKVPAAYQDKMKMKLEDSIDADMELQPNETLFDKFVNEFGFLKPNKEIPAASDAVKLKHSAEFGRHLVAKRNIRPGEVLIHEQSYCSAVNLVLSFGYCWHCLSFAWSCVPCDHCVDVVFCSEKCKSQAWKMYHDVECAINCDVEAVYDKEYGKTSALALRLTISAVRELGGFEQLRKEIEEVEKNQDARTKGFKDGIFHSNKYRSVYSLSNAWKPEPKNKISTINIPILAAVTTHLLATRTEFFGKKFRSWNDVLYNEDMLFIAEIFARNFGICSTNSFAVHDDMNGQILPVMSLLNHSCYPNAQYTFRPKSNIVYAVQEIKKGEQIFILYFDAPDKTRMMDSKYFFKCKCILCENDIPATISHPSFKQVVSSKETVKLLLFELRRIQPYLNDCERMQTVKMSPEKALQILRSFFNLLTTFDKYVEVPCSEVQNLRDGIFSLLQKND